MATAVLGALARPEEERGAYSGGSLAPALSEASRLCLPSAAAPLLQAATLSTKLTRSSSWSAHTSTSAATPPALAPKSSEVSFTFWGPQAGLWLGT